MHEPDRWVVLKITFDCVSEYKVLCGWSGGYLDADNWRLSAPIKSLEETDDSIISTGISDTRYLLRKTGEGFTSLMSNVLFNIKKECHTLKLEIKVISMSEALEELNENSE